MFDRILVPLDGSNLAEAVLPHIVTTAQAFDAQIILLRVMERRDNEKDEETLSPLRWQLRKSEAEAYLDAVHERLRGIGLQVEKVILEGDAAERIVTFAHEQEVDLLVLSSHGRSGLSKWNINSVVQKVILRAYVPTLIVRAYRAVPENLEGLRYRKLMVPLDGSQRAEYVLSLATSLAHSQDAQLLLAHVVKKPEIARRAPLTGEEQELVERLVAINRKEGQAYMADLESRLSADVHSHLVVGESIAASLHRLVRQEEVDLVLLSAHGYSGEAQWPYGSVTLNFIAYGATPLLIVQDISREEAEKLKVEEVAQEKKGH